MIRKIGFYQPYFATTRGHSNIERIIRSNLPEEVGLVPITTFSALRRLCTSGSTLKDVIVDFPDTAHRRALANLKRDTDTRFHYVDMFMPPLDPDPAPPVEYFSRLEFDPYHMLAETDQRLVTSARPALYHIMIGPQVNDETLALMREPPPTITSKVLIIATGTADERELIYTAAKAAEAGNSHPIYKSDEVPHSEYVHHRATSSRIWAAPGYSTTWELAALQRIRDTRWIQFDRPSESCAARLHTVIEHSCSFDFVLNNLALRTALAKVSRVIPLREPSQRKPLP